MEGLLDSAHQPGLGEWEGKEEPGAMWCLPVFQTAPPEQGAQAGVRARGAGESSVYVPAPLPVLICFKNPCCMKSATTTQIF